MDSIGRNSWTVVCPVIDVLTDDTLEYKWGHAIDTHVGGFSWDLIV